jgi:hypothetical protein
MLSVLAAGNVLKTAFLSLLAFQPAASAVEAFLFAGRRLAADPLPVPTETRQSVKIISDRAWRSISSTSSDWHDLTGHHRYYGRSSYV